MSVLVGLNKNIVSKKLAERLVALVDKMEESILTVQNENNSDFYKKSQSIRSKALSIINNNTVGEILVDLFSSYVLVANSDKNAYLLCKLLFDFGEQNEEAETNEILFEISKILNLIIRCLVLIESYNVSVRIDYDNLSELDIKIQELEGQYQKIIKNNFLDKSVFSIVSELRSQVMRFFSNLNLSSLTTIKTFQTSSRVLAYKLYKDSLRSDSIVKLNKAYNTGFISGEIKIQNETV